ncbi:2-hydroxyacid dehydrogenase [Parendozoicomonas haliclonae]|uniref:D-lactate dehydrogenase n=1 Tax=Parendozoicomonas haliclonae TaxID=1960125 RepID=A0A1X7ANA4_9GAMM|nr:2-hydroxyacid dehydrogenase [Parendozoicomonas haliclonae]SMA49554.1 D-lactate dehydrogenase [Parendozoicomonas haliclonae]
MKTLMFSTQSYERPVFEQAASQFGQEIVFQKSRLDITTTRLAAGYNAVCAFVNDDLSTPVLEALSALDISVVALRCAGFNQVNLETAHQLGIKVVRVPAYSPESVAEYTLAMILTMNRKIHKAWNRVREGNFNLNGLLGFNLHGKTVGLIGMGQIGQATANILNGFGMKVLAFDPGMSDEQLKDAGVESVALSDLYRRSDIVSLHCPLNKATKHIINAEALACMKPGAMLINTSRGALIDTEAVTQSLKSGHLGYLGIDVYEQEGDLFFRDLSEEVIQDDVFQRLLTFPNVVVTGHQGFFTHEALESIAITTLNNINELEKNGYCENEVGKEKMV